MSEQTTSNTATLAFRKMEHFKEVYGNNLRFEASVWDLKIVAGLLDQSTDPPSVNQQVALTIPWQQAKLMAYYLQVNLSLHEVSEGPVRVAPSVVPPPIEDFYPGWQDDPALKPTILYLSSLRKNLFGITDGQTQER